MAIKRNNAEATDAPTMPSGMGFASIMVQSAIALSLSVESHCFGQGTFPRLTSVKHGISIS
jgi:hypothetical protein